MPLLCIDQKSKERRRSRKKIRKKCDLIFAALLREYGISVISCFCGNNPNPFWLRATLLLYDRNINLSTKIIANILFERAKLSALCLSIRRSPYYTAFRSYSYNLTLKIQWKSRSFAMMIKGQKIQPQKKSIRSSWLFLYKQYIKSENIWTTLFLGLSSCIHINFFQIVFHGLLV